MNLHKQIIDDVQLSGKRVIIRAVLAALSAVPPHTPMRTAGRVAAGAQIITAKLNTLCRLTPGSISLHQPGSNFIGIAARLEQNAAVAALNTIFYQ